MVKPLSEIPSSDITPIDETTLLEFDQVGLEYPFEGSMRRIIQCRAFGLR
ncbi:hypothetical protein [Chroococcus sp. FPU101]|nr:hypothetical protein [Chroococcus sp. FPU101]